MKKLTGIVCLLALVLALTACAGAGDWKYEGCRGTTPCGGSTAGRSRWFAWMRTA